MNLLENIEGRYLTSVVNDLIRFEEDFSGYLLCIADDRYGFIYIKDSSIYSADVFETPSSTGISDRADLDSLTEKERVTIYTNSADSDTVEHLARYHHGELALFGRYELLDLQASLEYIRSERLSGSMAFHHGFVTNMAIFDSGEFSSFSYYQPEEKCYQLDEREAFFVDYLREAESCSPTVSFKCSRRYDERRWSRKLLLKNDEIVSMLLCYFDIFGMSVDLMKKSSSKEGVAEILTRVFDQLREKYAPLYKQLNYDPVRGKVNWKEILHDRKYVPAAYRFEHYHLYMDEMMKLLIDALTGLSGDDAVKCLRQEIRDYSSLYGKDRKGEMKKLFYRIDRMFNL